MVKPFHCFTVAVFFLVQKFRTPSVLNDNPGVSLRRMFGVSWQLALFARQASTPRFTRSLPSNHYPNTSRYLRRFYGSGSVLGCFLNSF